MDAELEVESKFGRSILVGNVLGAALLIWLLLYMARC